MKMSIAPVLAAFCTLTSIVSPARYSRTCARARRSSRCRRAPSPCRCCEARWSRCCPPPHRCPRQGTSRRRSDVLIGDICRRARFLRLDDVGALVLTPDGVVDDGLAVLRLVLVEIELGGENGHLTDAVELHGAVDKSRLAVGRPALRLAFKVETDPDLFIEVPAMAMSAGATWQ